MSHKHALLVLASTIAICGAHAQSATQPAAAPAEAPQSHWVITPSVVSQYMFRGVRLGGPAFQPSVEFDHGNGALGVWASIPIADKVPGQSDPEIDPYGSYTFSVSDKLSVQPGFSLYTYPRANRSDGYYKWTFEPNMAVSYTFDGVTFTPKLYYDMVAKGPTYELTAAWALPLAKLGTELDFIGTVGSFIWRDAYAESNPPTKYWGNYSLVGVTIPYQVGNSTKISAGIAYAKGSGSYVKFGTEPKYVNTSAVGRVVVTLSAGFTF